MFRSSKIKHPEWLNHSTPGRALELYLRGQLPTTIAASMIVIGLKHPLRAIYGSDLRAALALLWQATFAKLWFEITYRWWRLTNPEEVKRMEEDAECLAEELTPKV